MPTKQMKSELIPLDKRSDLGISPDDFSNYYYKDGKLEIAHGQWEIYYDNGNLFAKGYCDQGMRDGAWQYFFENGQIWQRGFYVNGERFGTIEECTWEIFDEDGNLVYPLTA